MEFLLINHPLDCPVCDKGGECPLQNQAMSNGRGESRFTETKRTFLKPINISAQVLLDRERCVLCARCTRFSEQIAGDPFIALIERGALQQVGIYEKEPFESYFSGNTMQICPVGALTSAAYRFRSRPFDLISTPSVCEHCASGCALRTDHRRGKVTRRLAGNDPERQRGVELRQGSVRLHVDAAGGPAHPADGARRRDRRAAAGFLAGGVRRRGPRAGGGAEQQSECSPVAGSPAEDAYAYGKFARAVLGTNDVDFRARPHSDEEADFLAAHIATRPGVTYADLEHANAVVLVGFEPEEESPIVFLRLRKGVQAPRHPGATRSRRTRLVAWRSCTARLLPAARPVPRRPPITAVAMQRPSVALDGGGVILVGERVAHVAGCVERRGRRSPRRPAPSSAWVPRRAGERGALETGLLPNLLPGGRPLSDAAARVDLAAAWGLELLSSTPGRDTDGILAAAAAGDLQALVVGGVEVDDLRRPGRRARGPRRGRLPGQPRGARVRGDRARRRHPAGRADGRAQPAASSTGRAGCGRSTRCSTVACADRHPRAGRHRRGARTGRSASAPSSRPRRRCASSVPGTVTGRPSRRCPNPVERRTHRLTAGSCCRRGAC